MSSERNRKRRSSFFRMPVEENSEETLELFRDMDYVNDEKDEIIASSLLFGGPGKQILLDYTENLKSRKQEYLKLISNKQEEHINLKEKSRKNKLEMDWETVCKGLTDFETDFMNNRPDYKGLADKVKLLTCHMTLLKRTNYKLHTISNTYKNCIHGEILKLQGCIVDKIVEDSGVGVSLVDICCNDETNSMTMKSLQNECSDSDEDSNDIGQE